MVDLTKKPDRISELTQSINDLKKNLETLTSSVEGIKENLKLLTNLTIAKPTYPVYPAVHNLAYQMQMSQMQTVNPSYLAYCCCNLEKVKRSDE